MRTPLAILTLLALCFCDTNGNGDSGCGGVVTLVLPMDYGGAATTTAGASPSDALPASKPSAIDVVDATVDVQFDDLFGSAVVTLVNTNNAATSAGSESFSTATSLALTPTSSSSRVTVPMYTATTAAPFLSNWSFNSTNGTTTGTGVTPLPTSLIVFTGANKSPNEKPYHWLLPALLTQAVAIYLI